MVPGQHPAQPLPGAPQYRDEVCGPRPHCGGCGQTIGGAAKGVPHRGLCQGYRFGRHRSGRHRQGR